ncbi:hypothetical protein VNO77_42905 [Canavalia gladiata]|uniref:Leucine-rich repeat-containing N-terminal plant-type domain-containing protein n=1 Tax=Canavalia gladiata TaxID=3824 RepID=A0AAN9JTU8_CANGL
MLIFTSKLSTFLLVFLLATTFQRSVSSDNGQVVCNEKDRRTLLKFKQGVIDPYDRLSWSNDEDCCAWNGVQCDNITGRVTNLDLRPYGKGYLQGELNLCLLQLEFLNSLDKSLHTLDVSRSGISFNDDKFWSMVAGINGTLDMSMNSISGDISNVTFKCNRIYLDHNNFTGGLPNLSPDVLQFNTVDFSYNSFSGSIPHGWANVKDMWYINLWSNKLSGEVPRNFSALIQLGFLNLGKNQFSGTIPIIMSQKLQVMVLRFNQFEGNIPPQIFNLSSLYHLDLANNKLSGSMPHCIYNMTQMIIYNIGFGEGMTSRVDLFTKGQRHLQLEIDIR